MTITIRTNNRPRPVVEAYELPVAARAEFDYLDWAKIEKGEDSASFVRYKGQWYHLEQFMYARKTANFPDWDGCFSDSMFSGVLIRYVNGNDVIVGMYFS